MLRNCSNILALTCAVLAQTIRYRDLFKDKGGYILTTGQALMDDIPLDNILSMYDRTLR